MPTPADASLVQRGRHLPAARQPAVGATEDVAGGRSSAIGQSGKIAEPVSGEARQGSLRLGRRRLGRHGPRREDSGPTFADDLVDACANLVRVWRPEPAPAWVTCMPSIRRRPDLVPDFARRMAAALDLPFHAALEKTDDRPRAVDDGQQQSAGQECRRLAGVAEGPFPKGPVLLVDDTVDSRWTLTIAAWLLTSRGSGPRAILGPGLSRPCRMNQPLSPNAQSILMLTAPLIAGRARAAFELLTLGEYNRLARLFATSSGSPPTWSARPRRAHRPVPRRSSGPNGSNRC